MGNINLEDYIRTIPNFPKEGIQFRDVTTVMQDANAFREAIDQMQANLEGVEFDKIVAGEARGFCFGSVIAYNLNKGFVPIRKKGKLPWKTLYETYDLEYGTATLEIHEDSIKPGEKVVVMDDLLATGGTANAMIKLVQKLGGEVVQLNFLVELDDFNVRNTLFKDYSVKSVIHYKGE